jgi:putative PIN family toxin of toxin-antitoxin system
VAEQKPRLVLDTNIIISAVISVEGAPAQLLRACLKNHVILLVSDFILAEYFEVLKYPKIQKYKKLDDSGLQGLSSFFLTQAERVEVFSVIKKSKDPDDDKFLSLAVEGKADFLITGDKTDLLSLKEIHQIPIISARQAVDKLKL